MIDIVRRYAVSVPATFYRHLVNIFACLILTTLSGCTIVVKAPKTAFNLVGNVESEGYDVDYAFNSSVIHWPGMTWSISGSYIPSQSSVYGTGAGDGPHFSYIYKGRRVFQLYIKEAPSCVASEAALKRLHIALNDVFSSVGGFPSRGQTTLQLVASAKPVRRYALGASWGRAFRLDYKSPCFKHQGDTSLWYAAMLAMHESTHAALKLANRKPRSVEQEEGLAIGAEACLFDALAESHPGFSAAHVQLEGRLSEALQLQGKGPARTHELCDYWKNYVRASSSLNVSRQTRRQ